MLKDLAAIISRNIRKNVDSGYRYGGDEFAVTILHAHPQQALSVAERLRAEYNEKKLTPTSLSIGIAKLESSPGNLVEDLTTLIREADKALYLAKSEGGDQSLMLGVGSYNQPSSKKSNLLPCNS